MPDGLDNANQKNITIILADDHTMMREGTRRLLEEDEQLKVIGEAETGTKAIALCRQLHPDIIVLDIAMKETNCFRVARELLSQRGWKPGILVLTAYDQVAYVRAMLNLGVQGYWLKTARGSDIRAAVHLLAMWKESIAPDIYRLLREDVATTPINGGEPLTSRELAVLLLVVS